jgi:hypothetical protein
LGEGARIKLCTWPLRKEGKKEDGYELICIMIKPLGFELEWIPIGLHRSSFGAGLNGQPFPILTARFKGVAPIRTGTRRRMTVMIMILDFMILFLLWNNSNSYASL